MKIARDAGQCRGLPFLTVRTGSFCDPPMTRIPVVPKPERSGLSADQGFRAQIPPTEIVRDPGLP
ncbi:MAG: hypothetical protein NTV08_09580 [Verrucomicrobia bacterium]|nr:hypothetical protein [Verrucomicrobiota bacterium]